MIISKSNIKKKYGNTYQISNTDEIFICKYEELYRTELYDNLN